MYPKMVHAPVVWDDVDLGPCPGCGSEIDLLLTTCPNCKYDLIEGIAVMPEAIKIDDLLTDNRNNKAKVQEIIIRGMPLINCEVESEGWAGRMVMKYVTYHPNRAQITLGKQLSSIFNAIGRLQVNRVPKRIFGYGVDSEAEIKAVSHSPQASDIPIYTRYDLGALQTYITKCVKQFVQDKSTKRMNLEYLLKLSENAKKEVPLGEIAVVNVDCCIVDPEQKLVELKSTGHEDANGAEATLVKQILLPFVATKGNKKTYLGVITNSLGRKKNGEWKGPLGRYLAKELVLVAGDLWTLVGPSDVSFNEFTDMVEARYDDLASKKGYKKVR